MTNQHNFSFVGPMSKGIMTDWGPFYFNEWMVQEDDSAVSFCSDKQFNDNYVFLM